MTGPKERSTQRERGFVVRLPLVRRGRRVSRHILLGEIRLKVRRERLRELQAML
jgi:hypothetical protein